MHNAHPRNENIIIETKRLYLRRWRRADLAPFAAINACPQVNQYLPGPLNEEQSNQLAQRLIAHFEMHGFGYYAVEHKQDKIFIGFTGLNISSFDAPFTPAVDIGWRIDKAYWGQGYATEAAQAVVDYAGDKLKIEKLVSFTVSDNKASRNVMEKIGMHHDMHGDFEHPALPINDPLRRHVLYRLDLPRKEH